MTLKQHYVTLTATYCFKKQNEMMHINTLHRTAILVKQGHILRRKCPPVFPLMPTTALSVCSLLCQAWQGTRLKGAELAYTEVTEKTEPGTELTCYVIISLSKVASHL